MGLRQGLTDGRSSAINGLKCADRLDSKGSEAMMDTNHGVGVCSRPVKLGVTMSRLERTTALPPADAGSGLSHTSELFFLVLDELRRVAEAEMRCQRSDHTLQPTALVDELWLRLTTQLDRTWNDRSQFVAYAVTVLRRVLIDHANRRNTIKRGGGWRRVPFDEAAHSSHDGRADSLALHEAVKELSMQDPRLAEVVQLRFLQGLSVEETARTLGVSVGTVERRWRFARAFLSRVLGGGE